MKTQNTLNQQAHLDLLRIKKQYYLKKAKEKLYDTVSILAMATDNVSFATIPARNRFFYIGISNILRKPEFMTEPEKVTKVIEILENELANVLSDMDITDDGAIYIGEENLLPEFQSCSLMALPYSYEGFEGIMGILGSTRMNYAYSMAALKAAVQLLNQ
jgi:heat-inducible transcriptional repressor